MKKYLIFLFLFVSIILSGQGRFPYGTSTHLSGGGGGAPAFLTSDGYTEGWYIAEEGNVTKDGSNYVSQWDDESGNANHLVQATGDNQPLWSSNGILFDGTNDNLTDADFAVSQPIFIYLVMKQVTWTAFDRFVTLRSDVTLLQLRQMTGTPQVRFYAGGNTVNNGDLAVDTWGIIRVLISGADSEYQVNGNAASTIDASTDGMTVIRFGVGEGNIEVKEAIVRSVDDSGANETAVMTYLNDKYSVY